MTTATAFDTADVELLLEHYEDDGSEEPRRPPWVWAALNEPERLALLRMCEVYISSYNAVHAVTDKELIPPCWVLRHELAAEVAVQVWLYYAAHLDKKATPVLAADYYGRHLPGFRGRIDRMLGRSPGECRKGQHTPTWRKTADDQLAAYTEVPADQKHQAVELLASVHFGFSHVGFEG